MADHDFEMRLQRVIRAEAERAVRPFDAVDLALASAAAPGVRRIEWRPAGWPAIRMVVIAAMLLLVAFATLWIVAGLPRPSILEADVPPTYGAVVPGSMPATLAGPWIADRPATLSFGSGSPAPRMSFFVDGAGSYVFIAAPDMDVERLPSDARMDGDGVVKFTSRSDSEAVQSEGSTIRGCRAGETGRYSLARSADGLRLTFALIDDPCPARAVVFARTWTRSLGLPNSGGAGVVDAFDPLFTVAIPPGGYLTSRSADYLAVWQIVPEFQFITWKDPQGWNDPCDRAKGRYEIEPGADAFVAYYRQLEGFTVDSTRELEVDGHRAVQLTIHANPDIACSQPWQSQAKAETGMESSFLRPGDADSLVIVELAGDTTLMFEVLPAPNGQEAQVLGSIRFLDSLPSSP